MDTDLILLQLPITRLQAVYLRRKLRQWSKEKLKQAKRDPLARTADMSKWFEYHIMVEALVSILDQHLGHGGETEDE